MSIAQFHYDLSWKIIMAKKMNAKNFNDEILQHWGEYYGQTEEPIDMPILYPSLKRDCLLFIGINPSINQKHKEKIQKETELSDLWDYRKYCEIQCEQKKRVEQIIEFEEKDRVGYSYYSMLKNITKKLGVSWEHVDLFWERSKSQRHFATKYLSGPPKSHSQRVGFTRYNVQFKNDDFSKKQLELSVRLIKALNPKLIVVANALASKIISGQENVNIECFDKKGYYQFCKIPMLLTGMFNGRRALDTGTRQLLIWNIRRCLNGRKTTVN